MHRLSHYIILTSRLAASLSLSVFSLYNCFLQSLSIPLFIVFLLLYIIDFDNLNLHFDNLKLSNWKKEEEKGGEAYPDNEPTLCS